MTIRKLTRVDGYLVISFSIQEAFWDKALGIGVFFGIPGERTILWIISGETLFQR